MLDVGVAVGPLDSIAVAGHDGPGVVGAETAVAARIVALVALFHAIFPALGTVQTSELVAELEAPPVVEFAAALVLGILSAPVPGPEAPPTAEHLAVLVLEPGVPPAPELVAELEAEIELVYKAVAEENAKPVAELSADTVVALVFGVVAAVARTGGVGVIENGIRSDPFPGSMPQSSVLVDSSVRCALEVIGTSGIERRLHGQPGPSAPHRRMRDAGSGDRSGQGHHCCDFLDDGPPLSD